MRKGDKVEYAVKYFFCFGRPENLCENVYMPLFAEPPTRLEIRDTSPSRPISDQQMIMSGNSKHSDPSVAYMGPYSEGQSVTLVCSAFGGNNC